MVRKMVGIVVFDFFAGSLYLQSSKSISRNALKPPCVCSQVSTSDIFFQSKKLAWHTTKKFGESPLISLIFQTPTFLKLTHRHLLLCLLTQRSLFK